MRIVIADHLTTELLERHADVVSRADACWTYRAMAHDGAARALSDARWWLGTYPLFDAAENDLGRWEHEIVDAQQGVAGDLVDRALLVFGLHARLEVCARARAAIHRIAAEADVPLAAVRLDVIGSDPYLRQLRDPAIGEIKVRAGAPIQTWADSASEIARASRTVRRIELLLRERGRVRWPERYDRHVGFFALEPGYERLFAPVLAALRDSGWHVTTFDGSTGDPESVTLDEAARSARIEAPTLRAQRWTLPAGLLARSPVPRPALIRALDASWSSAATLVERHRRALSSWRPDVVVSYGPDLRSLALVRAARGLGIPSLFLPHGFLTPVVHHWVLPASATAVAGGGCLERNATSPVVDDGRNLVPLGLPGFDELMAPPRKALDTTSLGIPASRPHVVLFFGEWARDLLDQAIQRRTLRIAAGALPEDALLVCKLHPGENEASYRGPTEAILAEHLPQEAFRVVDAAQFTTPDLLRICAVAVGTEDSMALSDAIVAGVPAIAVRHPEQPYGSGSLDHPAKDYEGVCRVVTDVDGLRQALRELVNEGPVRAQLPSHRAGYIRRYLTAADGLASHRIAGLIEQLARGASPAVFTETTADLK